MQAQQADIVESHLNELFKLCAQLQHRFVRLNQAQLRQIRLLKLVNNRHLIDIKYTFLKRDISSTPGLSSIFQEPQHVFKCVFFQQNIPKLLKLSEFKKNLTLIVQFTLVKVN
jgi:hypothetical protein